MYVETLGAEQYGTTALPRKGKAFDVSIGEGSKVNRICDAFLNILRDRPSLHIQNIISAHACKFPPDLDSGLSEIARLKSMNLSIESLIIADQIKMIIPNKQKRL